LSCINLKNTCPTEYEDFLRATLNMESILFEKKFEMAFKFFDTENKGVITPENLKVSLGLCVK